VIASLIMPSESLCGALPLKMQSPLRMHAHFSIQHPFGSEHAMIFYAGLYLAIAMAFAIRRFPQRDL